MRPFAFIIIALLHWPAQAAPVRLNTGFGAPVADIFRDITHEAFSRVGISVTLDELPAERSLLLANAGIDDGDCCRIAEAGQLYTHLLKVPEAVIKVDFVAFSRDPALVLRNWADLKPYDVGIVRGWKILEVNIADIAPRTMVRVESARSLFQMLRLGRIDVATIGRRDGLKALSDLGFRDIHVIEPPLASRDLYLYLHKSHHALIPPLSRALQDMRREGLLDAYANRVMQSRLNPSREQAN